MSRKLKLFKPDKWAPKTRRTALIAAVAAFALFAGAVALSLFNNWQVEFTGLPEEDTITVECGSEYAPPEVTAELRGNVFCTGGRALEVEREGEVDFTKPGEYELSWRVSYFGGSKTPRRVVRVVDTTPPVITLTPEEREYVLPGADYDDPGYSAADIADGDLTARVVRTIEGSVATYTVSDAAGNVATATREIPFDDPVPPEITLKGEKSVTYTVGEGKYEEPGFTAADNLDGDVTDKVEVKGAVDDNNPGVYTLRYVVKDSYGNETTVRRTVTVRAKDGTVPGGEDSPEIDGAGKVIYLTFDDGPSKYTEKLLDVLKKYNVKATFFVVKTGRVDLIAREAAEGHTVAIHSLTHEYKDIYKSEEAYFADLDAMNEIIKEKTGSYSKLLRFPGGSSNTVSRFNKGIMTRLAALVEEKGYKYFDWNVSSGDAGGTTSTEQVYKNVIGGVKNRKYSIVLQHDIKGFSVDAVERIIVWGLEHGFTFLPLTEESPGAHFKINN
ncbi:MAG: polysaccharide deacetylase family protein [Clostridia bacterium]|nr:polysaccharide deacetylase family protein [Clostridia bacterium]